MGSDDKLIVYGSNNFNFDVPTIEDDNAKKKVVKEIDNAWKSCIRIDNRGWLWVEKERLNSILRTSKANINSIVMKIEDEYKMYDGKKVYIRGFKVLALLAKELEENGAGSKGVYLDVSRQYYDAINICDKAKLLRLEYDKALSAQRKGLKGKRKTKYKIKVDELTGDKLKVFSEFSHIRSVAIYKELADSVENGLLVNKDTHKIITARGINHEEELKKLCIELGWSLKWYDKYKVFLQKNMIKLLE